MASNAKANEGGPNTAAGGPKAQGSDGTSSTRRPSTSVQWSGQVESQGSQDVAPRVPTTPVHRPLSSFSRNSRSTGDIARGGRSPSPFKAQPESPTKSRAASARLQEAPPRPKSRLDYFGFEEYDGGMPSRVGRHHFAVMSPPKIQASREVEGNKEVRTGKMAEQEVSGHSSHGNDDDYFSHQTTHQVRSWKNLSTPHLQDGPETGFMHKSQPNHQQPHSQLQQQKQLHEQQQQQNQETVPPSFTMPYTTFRADRSPPSDSKGSNCRPQVGTRNSIDRFPSSRSMNGFSDLTSSCKVSSDPLPATTTASRAYRYDQKDVEMARSLPFKHESNIKIAVEGQRYLHPEKKDTFVRFNESSTRTPFRPRHTPPSAFPPPGSDMWVHGSAGDIQDRGPDSRQYFGSLPPSDREASSMRDQKYHQRSNEPLTSTDHHYKLYPASKNVSKSHYGFDDGSSQQYAPRFRTSFNEGTTTKTSYRDHGVLSEEFRPRAMKPWSSLKTGREGAFECMPTYSEHFQPRPISSRAEKTEKREQLQMAPKDQKMNSETTYQSYMETDAICTSPRKRVLRFSREYRHQDQLDWM